MKAFVHEGKKGMDGARMKEMDEQSPEKGEVRVKLKTAGLNHRDLFVLEKHGEEDPALVIGSDGAGIVESVGEGVSRVSIGDEVVINPSLGWLDKSDAPPDTFGIVGLPGHGTFAEKVVVPEDNLEQKPAHLSWEEAGVFSLAALTAYRALFTRAQVKEGDTVFLPGVGSGAVTFLMMFAKAAGVRVIVTSRSEEKRQKALELGADKAIDSEEDWEEALKDEKVDIAIETVGAATFNKTLKSVRKGGTLVTFGASAGDEVTFDLRSFFYGQYNLLGSTMGSRDEYQEMLQFISEHNIKPVMDTVYSLENTKEAMMHLSEAKQLGKIALKIGE
ncbi:alcohol dehydrogenase [Salipaludibacillus keqinensis]|uniref:Alcohol dehydrogenase n=1 Tax=Salipaludibacillus keqinensis TaxID=2045207 RepID=A0A323TG16_9BACI|nr:zinc-binding dehydrogenase [Salipaludibacillus keqinensis]PYZ93420.1 alcohol dehydrogenase [Salipaludibacillus keqinensis]